MVYPISPLRQEQTRKLALWQYKRNLRQRWIKLLLLALILLWFSELPTQWGLLIVFPIFALSLTLGFRRARRLWAQECERHNTPGFLTITEAGVLVEYEGMSSYTPWHTYKDANIIDDVLVLTMAAAQDICWNLETCTDQQRAELLQFARTQVRSDKGIRMAPPRPVLTATPVPQIETMAQALEMGDIMLAQRKFSIFWYYTFTVLVCAAVLVMDLLYGMEYGFSESTFWAFGAVIFAWFIYRGIRTMLHPGLPQLRRSIMASGRAAGEVCERYTDGKREYIIYPSGKWLRADYDVMKHAVRGRHICSCRINNITFAYPNGTEPALFTNAGRYSPSRAPLIVTLLGFIPMLAMAGYALWAAPEYPFSFTVWFFTEYLF